jgi:hypothetical protein
MRNHLLPALFAALLTVPVAAQQPPTPGPEHKQLLAYAGTWDAVIEMTDETGKQTTSKGVSKLAAGPGGFWIVDDFQAEMMGAPFTGHGTTGYDQTKGKYVGTWIDSWSSSVMVLEGTYDAAKKALTLSGMAPGMDGKPVLHTMVTTDKDANTRVFEMFLPGPDGKAMKVMTITYTRAPQKTGGR